MFSEAKILAVVANGGWHLSATVLVYLYNFVSQASQSTADTGVDWYSRIADTIGIMTFIVGGILALRAKNELQKLRELINRVNLVQDITDAKRVLITIQNLHLDMNEINLRRSIDHYSQVREQLLRIKEHTEGLTRDQEREFLRVLTALREMQNTAGGIVMALNAAPGASDSVADNMLDVQHYNSQLANFGETLEKILADTKKGVGK